MNFRLHRALATVAPNAEQVIYPRVYAELEPGRFIGYRSLIGIYHAGTLGELLERSGEAYRHIVPYAGRSIAIRKSRYAGEGWLVLADPAESARLLASVPPLDASR
jgi:hypothetical protein